MANSFPNILLIAYYFPPLGMGGIGRALALYKYLKKFGYNVSVLTVKNITYPEYDYTQFENVDSSNVFRTGSFDPSRLMYLLGKRKLPTKANVGLFTAGRLCRPDYKRGWNYFAYREACSIINKRNIQLVITTSPPPSSHMIGLKLKKKFNLPWIADFRDVWYSLPIEDIYKSTAQKEFSLDLKRKIIGTADEVVGVNKSILKYLGRGELIYNAADDEVVDYWQNNSTDRSGKFEVGILGSISRLTPIGPLFKILHSAIKKNPQLANRLQINHAGKCVPDQIMQLAAKYNLESSIKLFGYLPQKEAIETLAGSNLLYISVIESEKHHILPGRIFDMLVSGKPILGVAHPESDLSMILNSRPGHIVVNRGNLDTAVEPIISLIGKQKSLREESDMKKYTATTMVKKYASLINKLLNG